MSESVEQLEKFAAEHGIPALLDHLGLDGLANEVNTLLVRLNHYKDALERVAHESRDHGHAVSIARGAIAGMRRKP